MTKKTEKTTKKDVAAKKKILYEAVKEHPEKNYIIVGALTRAGLVGQYLQEEAVYGVEDLTPSITDEELDKIIKDFLGA